MIFDDLSAFLHATKMLQNILLKKFNEIFLCSPIKNRSYSQYCQQRLKLISALQGSQFVWLSFSIFFKTLWPSGLRRWLKAPVRKGVGSNPTGVILFYSHTLLQTWKHLKKNLFNYVCKLLTFMFFRIEAHDRNAFGSDLDESQFFCK